MKILIDCLHLRNKHTGVDTYSINLIRELASQLSDFDELIIIIDRRYTATRLDDAFKARNKKVKIIKLFSFYHIQYIYSCFLIPFYLRSAKFDVYHNHYFFGPLIKFVCPKTKIIITVHDIFHITKADMISGITKFYMNTYSNPSIKRADKIVVLSEFVKNDLIEIMSVNENKIIVIPTSCAPIFRKPRYESAVLTKYHVQAGNYFFYAGWILPRKGIDDLLSAYNLAFTKNKALPDLILAGKITPYIENLQTIINTKLNPAIIPKIQFVGYIDTNELLTLYSSAKAFILPSHVEGFGFPALEAMAIGCPLIARRGSSLKEVIDDGGMLFNTIEELSEQILKIADNEQLRNELIQKGFNRASLFSWEKAASSTYNAYK